MGVVGEVELVLLYLYLSPVVVVMCFLRLFRRWCKSGNILLRKVFRVFGVGKHFHCLDTMRIPIVCRIDSSTMLPVLVVVGVVLSSRVYVRTSTGTYVHMGFSCFSLYRYGHACRVEVFREAVVVLGVRLHWD